MYEIIFFFGMRVLWNKDEKAIPGGQYMKCSSQTLHLNAISLFLSTENDAANISI